jgi:hypothetical protein
MIISGNFPTGFAESEEFIIYILKDTNCGCICISAAAAVADICCDNTNIPLVKIYRQILLHHHYHRVQFFLLHPSLLKMDFHENFFLELVI